MLTLVQVQFDSLREWDSNPRPGAYEAPELPLLHPTFYIVIKITFKTNSNLPDIVLVPELSLSTPNNPELIVLGITPTIVAVRTCDSLVGTALRLFVQDLRCYTDKAAYNASTMANHLSVRNFVYLLVLQFRRPSLPALEALFV